MRKLLLASALVLAGCTFPPDKWLPYYAEEMSERGWTYAEEVIYLNGQPVFFLGAICSGRYGEYQCGEYVGPPYLYEDVVEAYRAALDESIAEQLEKDRNILALPKKDG